MLYRPCLPIGKSRFFTKQRDGNKFTFRTVSAMRKLYPNGDFVIIGEIGGSALAPSDGDKLLVGDGKAVCILPRGSMKRPFEWVSGYIPVGQDTYIAAIESLIPSFLRRRQHG